MLIVVEEIIKRRVIQLWLSGEARDKIAAYNKIGAGTVSAIIDDYKTGLDHLDLDSFREIVIEAKKRGITPSDLASHFRLFNYLVKSGAAEDQIESFIINVNSDHIPIGKAIELVNQIYEISKAESIPPDQLPEYIKQKLVEKQRIDEAIQQADAVLQSKNVTVEAIDEHIKLNEKLKEHGLYTGDIHKLLSVLSNAKKYGFDGREITAKLYDFKFLEWKEKELKDKHKKLSKRMSRYKDIIPFTEEIAALKIGVEDLIALKIAIYQAAKMYNLPFVSASFHLIDDIKK